MARRPSRGDTGGLEFEALRTRLADAGGASPSRLYTQHLLDTVLPTLLPPARVDVCEIGCGSGSNAFGRENSCSWSSARLSWCIHACNQLAM